MLNRHQTILRVFFGAAAFAVALTTGMAARGKEVDYFRDVKPLLKERCTACHGPLAQNAGLRLDAAVLIHRGGDSGPALVAGDPSISELLRRVTADDHSRMPPPDDGERLTHDEIAVLTAWIASGAPLPKDEIVLDRPEDHWAYQPPRRPSVPRDRDPAWTVHPIDAFLTRQRDQQRLKPVEPASKEVVLRRVYLDLIGLPPLPSQLHAFLADESPNAYERVVDELLASPHYGERWGRHWMDVWRYSDWDGYRDDLRGSQRHIWRWRDWIIESLNADKGYDRMILEMLAGDEIAPDDPATLRATGFLVRSHYSRNRNPWLDAAVEHTARAFLGTTINCARCHDHKYDPISQQDYYRLRAIFEPFDMRIDRIVGQPDLMQDGLPRIFDRKLDAETYVYIRGDEKQPDKTRAMEPGVPTILSRGAFAPRPISIPRSAWYPMLSEAIEREDLDRAESQARQSAQALKKLQQTEASEVELHRADLQATADRTHLAALRARWLAEKARYLSRDGETTESLDGLACDASRLEGIARVAAAELDVLLKRQAAEKVRDGNASAKTKAESAFKAAEKSLASAQAAVGRDDGKYTPVGAVFAQTSTGRRTALAQWITDVQNPLTARVAVNHIWLRHFGSALVENVDDFGLNTPRPELADLLDWLAVEFMEPTTISMADGPQEAWSMKRLHRLIVTSHAYRLSSAAAEEFETNRRIDPANRYFWRYNSRRLEAEVVRDGILAAAGTLDRAMGGPDIDYADGESVLRRSVYFRTAFEKQMPLLVLFDGANPAECYRRSTSIVPQQALALANSPLSLTQSRHLARAIWDEVGGDAASEERFVTALFERVLSRAPSLAERQVCLDFLERQTRLLAADAELTLIVGGAAPQLAPAAEPAARARENLVHGLFNHNDFVTVR